MSLTFWMDNLLWYCAQVAVVVLGAAALPALLRVRDPRLLLGYWRALLAFVVALPFVQPWLPTAGEGIVTAGSIVLGAASGATGGPSIAAAAASVIVSGICVRACWLVLGLVRLRRYRRRARPLPVLPEAVVEVRDLLGVAPDVMTSDDVRGPITFGVVRPVVLLPADFLDMKDEYQRSIACHEFLHVRRRDWAFALVEEVARVLLWFHPAVWWLVGRLQLTREQVVDAEVLSVTRSRRAYLEALLHIARHGDSVRVHLAHPFSRTPHLTRRVALIVKEVSMSKPRFVVSAVVMAACTLLVGTIAAAAFPLAAVPGTARLAVDPAPAADPAGAVGEGDVKPVFRVQPFYPEEAKGKKVEGIVRVEATVDESGAVVEASAIEGPELLRPPSVHAMKQWQFSNATGKKVVLTVTFNFSLDKPAEHEGEDKEARVYKTDDGKTWQRVPPFDRL
jgi:TonB family protein